MKIIAKYIHGSEDSTDVDIHYVVDKQPSFQEAKAFCDADLSENRNIITIRDSIVTGCYKGTVDEINNALLDTYSLHPQEYPLLVTRRVERNKPLKYIRAIRIILSHLSRSQYRSEVKLALRSGWNERLDILDKIDLTTIDFSTLNKHLNDVDILKVIAFQLGQCMLLRNNVEAYTKSKIAMHYSPLTHFLYRKEPSDIVTLDHLLHYFIQHIREDYMTRDFMIDDNHCVWFIDEDKKFDLKTEKQIDYQFGEEKYKILKINLDWGHKALFDLAERNDVFLWVYHMEKLTHNELIDASMRFVVYIPIELWRNELIEKYGKHSDDLYEIDDNGVKRLAAETKKCKEFLEYVKMIREEYIEKANDFFSKFE